MRLDQIKRNGAFRVTELDGDNASVARLMSLGLLPGKSVRLTHEAPFGDPIAVRFDSCHVSLRRDDAAAIQVEQTP